MNKTIRRDEIAALMAERGLLRAALAKARHHKKPYETMTTEEYRAALNKLGLSIVASAEHLGLSRRQSQRYANGTSVSIRIPCRGIVLANFDRCAITCGGIEHQY